MQNRLIACVAGAVAGLIAAPSVSAALALSSVIAFTGCGLAGVTVGYLASILLDVFASGE